MDNSRPPEGRNSELDFAVKDITGKKDRDDFHNEHISLLGIGEWASPISARHTDEALNVFSTLVMIGSATGIQAYNPIKGHLPRELSETAKHTPTSHSSDLLPCEFSLRGLRGCNSAFNPRAYTTWVSECIAHLRKRPPTYDASNTSWDGNASSNTSLQRISHWEGHLSRVPGRLLESSGKRLDQLWSRVQTAASKNEYLDTTITYLHRPPILFLLSTITFTLAVLSLRHAHRFDRYQDRVVMSCALAGVLSALLLVQTHGEGQNVVMSLKAHFAWGIAVGLVLSWIAHRVAGLAGRWRGRRSLGSESRMGEKGIGRR